MKMRLELFFMTAMVTVPGILAMPLGQVPTITVDLIHDNTPVLDVLDWFSDQGVEDIFDKYPRRDHMKSGQQSLSWDTTSSLEPLDIVILPPDTTLMTIIKAPMTSVETHISTADYPEESSFTWSSQEPADTSTSTKASHKVSYTISHEPIPTSRSAAVRTSTHETTVTVTVTPTSTITVTQQGKIEVGSSLAPLSSSITEPSESLTASDTTPDFPSSWVYTQTSTTTYTADLTTDEPPEPTDPEVPGEDTENDARPFKLKHPMMFTFALGAAMAVALV